MKTKALFRTLAAIVALGLMAAPVSAQTLLNNTTLSAAVTDSQTYVTLTSATGAAIGSLVVIPGLNPEVMLITAVNGTRASVIRGYSGQARAHASSTVVFVDVPQRFYLKAPDISNSCTRSAIEVLPYVDTNTGIVYSCNGEGSNSTGAWYAGWGDMPLAFDSVPLR